MSLIDFVRKEPDKVIRGLLGAGVVGMLLLQFNNCGDYNAAESMVTAASVSCLNSTCITPNPNNMSVTPHLFNGEVLVPASLPDFNVGGDCNEGGYMQNLLHWELMLNGQVVRHSSMTMSNGAIADTVCQNGRFRLYVDLSPIANDPVDRTGVSGGGYTLNITLYGQPTASPNAPLYRTPGITLSN